MRGLCENANCTFNVTKQCVLGNPLEDCQYRPVVDDAGEEENESFAREQENTDQVSKRPPISAVGGAVLTRPDDEIPTLPASRTLSLPEIHKMMEDREINMIGIVGLPGAGKTACLVSAYLLLAKGQFERYTYADSATLRAFEEIARGSRVWDKGNPPEQITTHTTLTDDREAGFLHLRLRREHDGRLFELLLPDLPGEWSNRLIDQKDSERLQFLCSSSVIWLMVDGRQFVEDGTVAMARYRATLLIERLSQLLGTHRPRIIVVPTWQDKGEFPQTEADELTKCGVDLGLEVELSPIASFSWSEDIQPGFGVARLVDRSISAVGIAPEFWPTLDSSDDERQLAAFRGRA
ncbi:hypothetical protein [Novosphingobium sp.]|uniref:TRAFAC clade GTPase domain-containing protein n=1 Tax=Novosphingobium sp. TaxID=1874826 RepID=UPI00260E1727|nr:hypothetical protein [Novosphingobium sp.]